VTMVEVTVSLLVAWWLFGFASGMMVATALWIWWTRWKPRNA